MNETLSFLVRASVFLVGISLCATMLTGPANADEPAVPRVTKVVSSWENKPNSAGLDVEVFVTVSGAASLRPDALGRESLVLFFEGIPLPGIHPAYNGLDPRGNGVLRFYIDHSDESVALWSRFVRTRQPGFENLFSRTVPVSVGVMGRPPIETDVTSFNLILVRKDWFFRAMAYVGALIVLFLILAIRSDIVREDGPAPSAGHRRPFSLGRVQMAIWTLSIIAAWMLLFVLRDAMNTIPDSLVALMGISAGTGMAAARVGDSSAKGGSTDSRGFLLDVLGTPAGVSFYRFQMFAWTVVTVAVFWRQVISNLAMPEFPTSLLFLMGISSATYVGFKFTEQPTQATEAPPSAPPPSTT